MFDKIKYKLKYKLKSWLDVDICENSIELLNNTTKNINSEISHFQESVNTLHNTVENVVHIGTNVHKTNQYNQERSWAVICIEGKLNIVKFVSLDRDNAMDILKYLKQFEAGRHCIDHPYKELFYDELFKF